MIHLENSRVLLTRLQQRPLFGMIGAVIALLGATNCSESGSNVLAGSWSVHIAGPGDVPSLTRPAGVLVFDRGIQCYCRPEDPELPGSINGRLYFDYAAITQGRRAHGIPFARGWDSDQAEEARAEVRDRRLTMFMPGVAGFSFSGILQGDTIYGTWSYLADTPRRGRFLMVRVRNSWYQDSALVRSKRGVAEWRADVGAPTGTRSP
jgi:hypothetical protein